MKKPQFFTAQELLRSNAAVQKKIPNLPTWEQLDNLRELGFLLDKIRVKFGKPITVSSGFRSEKLNSALNGAKNSQHKNGEAADLDAYDNKVLFDTIRKMMDSGEITVGQLIWEYGTKKSPDWVHVSLPTEKLKNQVLYIGVK